MREKPYFWLKLLFGFQKRMPVPQGAMHGGGQPSCFDRVKMGFMMGMCVRMASGGILGGFGALRMGMRGRENIDLLSVHLPTLDRCKYRGCYHHTHVYFLLYRE